MKLTPYPNRYKPSKRPPLRSFVELAAEFGIKPQALAAHMSQHKGPAATLHAGNSSTGRNRYYDHAAMRKWWAEVQEKKPCA